MKKIFTLFAVILCATSAWAWCGNSFITVNGKWYTGSNSHKHDEGYFNDANLGDLTTLMLGGELQVYPKSGAAATLCYKIDDGGEKSISLPKTGEDGNNSKHSGSGKVDLSALSGGEHTISVWFKHNSDYDSNNSKNFVAKFNIPATAPDRYITGTIAGGWDGNEVKMTYDEKTQTYSHTFAANKLSAGVEYKLKVTGGNWDYHCGTINGTIPGVLNDGEGNVCFTLKTVGDVTISFQDAKITVATTGEFKVPVTYEYYILGTMNSWSVKEDYGLADEDNDGIYTREITLTSGQHDFKINVGNWDSQWGWKDVEGNYSEATDAKDDNKIKITLTAEKTFTVLFNTSSKKITFEGLTQIHTVKATVNPAEAGTIKGLAADGKYNHGAEATLTATPAEGYEFVNWTKGEEVVSTENPYKFTVTADVALVANFKEAEPEYQVFEDEITNFVFDTEAWPMVCQGGPSATYQIEVFLVLTEDADGTLSYEDCSVSIMGTDATFIEGTLSDLDVYAPSADAVLRVQWNGEFYELHLAMSAAAEPTEPTNVLVTNAVKSYDEGSGALKLTGLWEGAEVFVEIGGYEGKESIEYSTPQGVLFETPDVAAFGNEASIIVAGEDITVVCNGLKPMMGNDVYNVTITTLSEVSTALDNLNTTVAPVKMIENGQLIIVKDGVQYNAQGAILK